MAATGFHLIVTLLAFSHLVFMANAISTSGNIHRHMLHEKVEIKNQMVNVEETAFLDDEFMSERMDLEKTDYPGPGANRNHTPKPPQRD
ncbi:hypothetical protein CTI12_AA257460 [Artemisia annua]|uniref:Uncharacterized protein n=1 Tax=Artemisia annua TaxID=35608 RepID=A0A2U1LZM2_ARTAN|nr:hypothetical protein CTI12_AA435910 [Artemisia annua]PWA73862.1 hypothetical protein CTI12_AA257460 [Artemisia annua]